jgi:hypothetical protein
VSVDALPAVFKANATFLATVVLSITGFWKTNALRRPADLD